MPSESIKIIEKADLVYLESFTSPIYVKHEEEIKNLAHGDFKIAKRWMVEDGKEILNASRNSIVVLLSYGYNYLNTNKYNKMISTIFIICSIYVGSVIAFQHKQPTAISKVKDYLIELREPLTIITTPLISYYLKSSGVNFTYYDAHKIDPTIHNYGDDKKLCAFL